MRINNLAELKRVLKPGVKLFIIDHHLPSRIGTTREVVKLQTKSIVVACGGKIGYMDIPKSKNCSFGETVKVFNSDNTLAVEFKLI